MATKPKLYLETTIPSYLAAWPSRDLVMAGNQQTTREWWQQQREKFDIYISELVIYEASQGDKTATVKRLALLEGIPELTITESVASLMSRLLGPGMLPPNAAMDAGHIALAAVHGMHFLLTWNCRHIANAAISRDVKRACEDEGFACPVICTPYELMGK
jgi:hypothetical protein